MKNRKNKRLIALMLSVLMLVSLFQNVGYTPLAIDAEPGIEQDATTTEESTTEEITADTGDTTEEVSTEETSTEDTEASTEENPEALPEEIESDVDEQRAIDPNPIPLITPVTTIDLSSCTLVAGYYDENNQWVEETMTRDVQTEFPYNATISMDLEYKIGNSKNVVPGQKYLYQVPSNIRVDENKRHDLAYTTPGGGTVSIGTVDISSDGSLIFIFNDNIIDQENIPFYVKFDGSLSSELQEAEKQAQIEFPAASGVFSFGVKTEGKKDTQPDHAKRDISIDKSGYTTVINGETYIIWNVNVKPNGRETLSGTISDTLPTGLHLAKVAGYPKWNEAGYASGSVTCPSADGSNTVQIDMKNLSGSGDYNVQFLTTYDKSIFGDSTITGQQAVVNNQAFFDSDDPDDKDVEDRDASVYITPQLLSKTASGINPSDNTITWTVVVNREKFDIGGTTLTDILSTDAGNVVAGSLTISDKTLTKQDNANGFTIEFPTNYNKEVTITYKTNNVNVSSTNIKNTATLVGQGYSLTAEKTVPGMDVLKKEGIRYNSVDQTVKWKITVGEDGRTLNNVILTDTIPAQEVPGKGNTVPFEHIENGAKIVSGADYAEKCVFEESTGKISLGTVTGRVVIELTTKVNPSVLSSATQGQYFNAFNNVRLESTEVNIPDKQGTLWMRFSNPNFIEDKYGSSNGDGTLSWTVLVKGQQDGSIPDSMLFKDELPADTEYVPGSMYIVKRYYDAGKYVVPDSAISIDKPGSKYVISYTLSPSSSEVVERCFTKEQDFEIHYQTRVTNWATAGASTTYTNKAGITATYDGVAYPEDEESETITEVAGGILDKTYAYKSGEDFVTWKVTVNGSHSNMNGVTKPMIQDTLADYFKYVSGTMYEITPEGARTEVNPAAYQVVCINQNLQIFLPVDAHGNYRGSNAYEFEFKTAFTKRAEALQGIDVKNTVNFMGSGNVLSKESNSVQQISFSSSSAGSYLKRQLKVKKVDSVTQEPLSGAKFELKYQGAVVGTAISDVEGIATFDDIPLEYRYDLVEITAPDGYLLPTGAAATKSIDFTDGSLESIKDTNFEKIYQITIANTKASDEFATLKITKRDKTTNKTITAEATFGLYSDEACNTLLTSVKTVDGVATFTNVAGTTGTGATLDPSATYYIKEIAAPAAYKLSDEVYKVEITSDKPADSNYYEIKQIKYTNKAGTTVKEENNTAVIDAGYTDEAAKGKLVLEKYQEGTTTAISGVKFELYKDALATDKLADDTTDGTGKATFNNLELGKTYYYRETEVPAGPPTYKLDSTIHEIQIGTGTEHEDVTVTEKVYNELLEGSIIVHKIDNSEPAKTLKGVKFKLFKDGTLVGEEMTTDANGIVKFENLPYGTYQLQETSGLVGYNYSSDMKDIVVDSITPKNVDIVNEKIKFTLKLKKTDNSASANPLSGAGFTLYSTSGAKISEELFTDASGELIFKDLEYRDYVVKETTVPAGYNKTQDQTITTANIDASALNVAPMIPYHIEITAVDDKQNGKIKATKLKKSDNSPLGGAEFTLYDNAGKVVDTTTSTADGIVAFTGLAYGTYYLAETQAPAGYQVDPGYYQIEVTGDTEVTVGIDQNVPGASSETLVITDTVTTPPNISFKVLKTNEAGNENLAGAIFSVYEVDENGVESTTAFASATTGTDGIAYFKLLNVSSIATDNVKGYVIRETQAPYGYKLSGKSFTIDASAVNVYADDKDSPKSDAEIRFVGGSLTASEANTVKDIQILGKISVTKYGVTSATKLEGAEFALYKDAACTIPYYKTGTIQYKVSTDATGVALFENLPCGTYYVKETKAPKGYKLSNAIITATVEDETTYGFYAYDSTLQLSISKRAVGSNANLAGAEFALYEDGVATPIDTWTSTTGVHGVGYSKLQLGGSYTLKETKAPKGYKYSQDVKFTINNDGSISITNATGEVNGTTVIMRDEPISFAVKKEKTGGAGLSNAILTINDSDNNELTRWTSDGTAQPIDVSIFQVPATSDSYNYYYLKEISAPDGYKLADNIWFALDHNGDFYKYDVSTDTVGTVLSPAVLTMQDQEKDETSVYLNKVDADTRIALAGAQFKLYAKASGGTETQVTSAWGADVDAAGILTTTGNQITINAATLVEGVGGTGATTYDFVLKEIAAPAGYNVIDDVAFTLYKDTSVDPNKWKVKNYADVNTAGDTFTVADEKLELYIRKQDGFGLALPGTTLEVHDVTSQAGPTYTLNATTLKETIVTKTSNSRVDFKNVELSHTYVLHEKTPAEGYAYADDIVFSVDANGVVTRADGEPVTGNLVIMKDNETGVTIRKVTEGAPDQYVIGAKLQLTSVDDPFFTTKTFTVTAAQTDWVIDFMDFSVGCSYILEEIDAPKGYAYAEPLTIKIDTDRKVYVDGVAVANRTVYMEDSHINTYISKVDMVNGQELPGAKLEIRNSAGTVIYSFTSGLAKTLIPFEKLNVAKDGYTEYTLTEITAPDGYEVAETINFALDSKGQVYEVTKDSSNNSVYTLLGDTVLMEDKPKFAISKQDMAGAEVPGAKIKITSTEDTDFTPIEFTSGTTPKELDINLFKLDKTYILEETGAPEGYGYAEQMTFKFDTDGVLYVNGEKSTTGRVVMVDKAIDVVISKEDLTNGKELPGAKLCIKDESGNSIYEFVSGTEPTKIPANVFKAPAPGGKAYYTLTEITAPMGYAVAETIKFALDSQANVYVMNEAGEYVPLTSGAIVMQDAPEGMLVVSKVDITNGEELPGAKLVIKDKSGNVIDTWVSTTERHLIQLIKFKPNQEYTLTEITAPDGYEVAETITFIFDEEGKLYVKNRKTGGFEKVTSGMLVMEDAPSTSTNSSLKTGDTAPIAKIAIIGLLSLVGIVFLFRRRRED